MTVFETIYGLGNTLPSAPPRGIAPNTTRPTNHGGPNISMTEMIQVG